MKSRVPTCRARVAAVALLALWGVGAAVPARADEPRSLREALFGQRPAESQQRRSSLVGRFISDDGKRFVFDRTNGQHALMRFERSQEIWVLTPSRGVRGDVIYKNDIGQPVLRFSRWGGATLFTRERPEGVAVAFEADAPAFQPPRIGPEAAYEALVRASARASRAASRLIPFDGETVAGSDYLIADAALVTAEAIVRLSASAEGRAALGRVRAVRLREGPRSEVSLDARGQLNVTVATAQGLAGRPSSGRIAAAIVDR